MNPKRSIGPGALKQLAVKLDRADIKRGASLYASRCAECHQNDGQGDNAKPPVWGERSYNDGASGERYASAEMTQRFLAMALGKRSETQDPIELLSDRELEIYRLNGTGFTTGAIAEQLFLSTHTIDTHRENIKRKLGCKTGAELSRQAMQSMLESN